MKTGSGGDEETVKLELGVDDADDDASLRARVAAALGTEVASLPEIEVRRRSLDARRGRVCFHLEVAVGPKRAVEIASGPREVGGARRVVIVGDGPAGLFCAYQLARAGIPAVVVDRGKPVQPRRRDLKGLNQRGVVDPDSNYCFGEGGAGTYSDGKLYTRANKRGDVRDVLEILAAHGAPQRILSDARPHIGSNKLPVVVAALRSALEAVGVEFRFGARVVGLERDAGETSGVRLADGERVGGAAVVLATGHSARDIHQMLADEGLALEAKAFALGLRIEHPQPLINRIQYGSLAGHPRLPPASYKLARQVEGRGVFSFCMCPGGWIVPASTSPGEVVVNGMSLSKRDSPFANSGLVVAVEVADVERAGDRGPLGGVALQRRLEEAAFAAGGGGLRAPAARVEDFLAARASTRLPATSYRPGLEPADLGEVLAATGLELAERLRAALRVFGKNLRGYLSSEAVLVGVESRTSSPLRIPRDRETLEHPDRRGLYPCGEGAGYAGGIVSAALDGMRVARAIESRWRPAAGP